jgi:plasmid stabilization system protein ParE
LAFRVDITETAIGDAEEYVRFIREQGREPEAAERWWRGLLDAIDSLEEMPLRCPPIPEIDDFEETLRHLLYYSHRIVFRVNEMTKTVVVLRIYHAARKTLSGEDFTD